MKNIGVLSMCLMAGFIGGTLSRSVAPAPARPAPDHIDLSDQHGSHCDLSPQGVYLRDRNGSRCELSALGVHVRWANGREVWLDGQGVRMECGSHFVNLGADDKGPLDASYLVLDGRVWHAPSSTSTVKVLAG